MPGCFSRWRRVHLPRVKSVGDMSDMWWSDPFCRRNASRKHQELEFLKSYDHPNMEIMEPWNSWRHGVVGSKLEADPWDPAKKWSLDPWDPVYWLRRLLGRLHTTLILCNVNFSQTKKCYGHNHAVDYIYPIRTLLINGMKKKSVPATYVPWCPWRLHCIPPTNNSEVIRLLSLGGSPA